MATETVLLAIASGYLGWILHGTSSSSAQHIQEAPPERMRCPPCAPCAPCVMQSHDTVMTRDRSVLHDPLYPPYNRPNRSFGLPDPRALAFDRGYDSYADTYRLVGYVFGENNGTQDGGGNAWKLFARGTGRGSRAEFYISPAYAGIDVKIMLDENTVVNSNEVRDIDNIPRVIRFKHPMLSQQPYTVTELPRADLVQSGPYF